jgi:hypothetical protein
MVFYHSLEANADAALPDYSILWFFATPLALNPIPPSLTEVFHGILSLSPGANADIVPSLVCNSFAPNRFKFFHQSSCHLILHTPGTGGVVQQTTTRCTLLRIVCTCLQDCTVLQL